ncbi:sensor domain-containing diguanylate cyclase [Ferribacterium limneticum]|jgi:diguanylate cyclase (GGDEF)-like protein|uniref:sensor domain-containing diguanylate cyclase n=1 Tax=Ferribacterium limneticum TaxID=76259 RepID=UPI001CF95E2C|nr:diguanylate cyclase [Ferribacterium limneticum]UCV18356.1 diguanylate cyclase [Ferribacterium limneticum]
MPRATDGNVIALKQLVEGNPVATIVIDAEHRVAHWNRACAVLTGVAAEDMIGSSDQWRAFYDTSRPILADLVVDGAQEAAIDRFYHGKFRHSALMDDAFEAEDFFPSFGQGGRWLFFTAAAIRNAAGEIIGAIETLQDVTERHRAEVALRDSEAYLAQIVDGSSVAMLVIDAGHRVTHWNRACESMTGTLARDVIGTSDQWKAFYASKRPIMADMVLDDASEIAVDRLYHGRFRPSLLIPGGYEAEDFFPHFGDRGRWLFFTAAPLRNAAGEVIGALETLQDVSERRRAEEALRESEERYRSLSQTDSLTGLYNSRYLRERLPGELERATRYGRPLSMLVIDCDNFKSINDCYGHLDGDKVLQSLAEVIRHCLRRSDSAYRYGGEEFVVLLPEADAMAAMTLAERLRGMFAAQETLATNGEIIRCTISIGVSRHLPTDNEISLIRRADEASYRAKERGKNCVVLEG